MDLKKLENKLITNHTVKNALEKGLFTIDQINSDSYLKCAYYFDSPIYVMTTQDLVSEPKIKRGVDLPEFFFDFIVSEGIVLMFLCGTHMKAKPLGRKDFVTVADGTKLPYGIFDFDDNFKYGMPILVVEGNKDCLVAKQYYKYTIAAETATLSSFTKLFLSTITDNLIVALDNDEAGEKGYKSLLYDKRFQCKRFIFPDGIKDFGDILDLYLTNEFDYSYYDLYIKSQLSVYLEGGN